MSRLLEIEKNFQEVQSRIAVAAMKAGREVDEITLIAVTKGFPTSDVEILKSLGLENFGENRDGDAAPKAAQVLGRWHFQGEIQSNKLKSICTWARVIHSLDDLRHFTIIEKSAIHPLDIFIQVTLDSAQGRGGAHVERLYPLASAVEASSSHRLVGLMAVAPLGVEPARAFGELALIHSDFLEHFPEAKSLSAGMSGDFEDAIALGATHLRIGSQILGSRHNGG